MKKNSLKNIFFLLSVLMFVLGCNLFGKTEKEATYRGRLKFEKTLRYGSVGTHGSQGWYVIDRQFYFNERNIYLPVEVDGCEPSPNESVEAFLCYKFKDGGDIVYAVRIKDEKPEWEKIYYEADFESNGKNLGEWADQTDGKWLIFKDFLYNGLNGEKIELKNLPDYPSDYFRAVSPDFETVVYEGVCFYGFSNAPEPLNLLREKKCRESERLSKKNLINLWLTNIKTGETKFIELSREKYDWLTWDQSKIPARKDWLKNFQQKLVWEKDQNGKFQLVFPK